MWKSLGPIVAGRGGLMHLLELGCSFAEQLSQFVHCFAVHCEYECSYVVCAAVERLTMCISS